MEIDFDNLEPSNFTNEEVNIVLQALVETRKDFGDLLDKICKAEQGTIEDYIQEIDNFLAKLKELGYE
jgi:hypothetical protein